MNNWEKAKIVFTGIASILIPLMLGFIGNEYSTSLKERELQGKFVELAINILSEEPTKENENIRRWGIDVINMYSGVPLDKPTKEDLIKKTPIYSPSGFTHNYRPFQIESGEIFLSVRVTDTDPFENHMVVFDQAKPVHTSVLVDGAMLKEGVMERSIIGDADKLKNKTLGVSVGIQRTDGSGSKYMILLLENNGRNRYYWFYGSSEGDSAISGSIMLQ